MNIKKLGTFLLLVCFLAVGTLSAQEAVGVIAKVQGDVQHRKFNADEYSESVAMGTQLKNHDWIKTGEDGFMAVFFLDDKSQLKVKSNSEMEILAAVERGKISKTISLDYGQVKADVTKQKGEFRIATPTSVASVKGTGFWVISNPDGDVFFVLDGVVVVENLISGVIQQVVQDQTAESNVDGTVDVTETDQDDIPDDPDTDEGTDNQDTGPTLHELKIRMVNEQTNDEKLIIIDFSE